MSSAFISFFQAVLSRDFKRTTVVFHVTFTATVKEAESHICLVIDIEPRCFLAEYRVVFNPDYFLWKKESTEFQLLNMCIL